MYIYIFCNFFFCIFMLFFIVVFLFFVLFCILFIMYTTCVLFLCRLSVLPSSVLSRGSARPGQLGQDWGRCPHCGLCLAAAVTAVPWGLTATGSQSLHGCVRIDVPLILSCGESRSLSDSSVSLASHGGESVVSWPGDLC